jgi:catechol 2,3-dioxygenase-like lactoylglutathione lyase family enzyme
MWNFGSLVNERVFRGASLSTRAGTRRSVVRSTTSQEVTMTIVLDHTIVPAHDKEASARFFARIFGLRFDGAVAHFAPVRVNDSLTLDFDTHAGFEIHHYAFRVSEPEFDAIFARVRAEGIPYGSGPFALDDMQTNRRNGGRGFYFRDPSGHILEVLTA